MVERPQAFDEFEDDLEGILLRIREGEALPSVVLDDPALFFRRIYNQFVENGGEISGKPRNSLSQIKRLLAKSDVHIASIQPKLAGSTRVTIEDADRLLHVFFKYWRYDHSISKNIVGDEGYSEFEEIDIDSICSLLVGNLRNKYKKSFHLPSTKKQLVSQREDLYASIDLFADIVPYADTIITISSHRTILAPDPIIGIEGFGRVINKFWDIGGDISEDGVVLIWIVDIGPRMFGDYHSMSAFYNFDYLAMQFRILSTFVSRGSDARWSWLRDRSIFVVGSLSFDEIDDFYDSENVTVDATSRGWAWLNADQILLGGLPDRWSMTPELRILYGPRLERLDQRTFVVFGREDGWGGHQSKSNHDLRYFGFGPNDENWNKDWTPETYRSIANTMELPSPDNRFDEGFRMVTSAAEYRLGRTTSKNLETISPLGALAHLRRLGFAVLKMDEFLRLNSVLTSRMENR